MLNSCTDGKDTAGRGARWWRLVVLLPLLALLALGFTNGSVALAHGSTPQRAQVISPETADAAPAIITMTGANGPTYIAWTGRNPAHNLNLMTYNPSTQTFGPAIVLTDTTLVGAGPSLVEFDSDLYLSWLGTDHRLNVGRFNPADPTQLSGKVTLPEYSFNAPAISVFGSRLYVSWTGTDGRLNILSSTDGATFNTKATYSIAASSSPVLVTTPFFLEIAWEEPSSATGSPYLVIAQYDPSNPGVLSVLVSTTATSQIPVGLQFAGVAGYPALVVAWRAPTDAHIMLGGFGGTPVVGNVKATIQTTNYAPALSGTYLMAWTGTNPGQNVNVTSVNV